jgi:aminoglycoside 6'-N-acetyltransferase
MVSDEFAFRSLARQDFALLSEWFSAPHVEIWWGEETDAGAIEERYGPIVDGTDSSEVRIIEREGQPLGLIQRYKLADNPAWQSTLSVTGTPNNAVGIDYLIGVERFIGRGLGPELIARFVSESWDRYPDIDAVVVSINENNRRSWRALEKVGFHRAWSGTLDSDDPTDAGTNHVYVLYRPVPRVKGG